MPEQRRARARPGVLKLPLENCRTCMCKAESVHSLLGSLRTVGPLLGQGRGRGSQTRRWGGSVGPVWPQPPE